MCSPTDMESDGRKELGLGIVEVSIDRFWNGKYKYIS